MASTTELDDAEFWLPSHFLTDDDILSDFGFGSGSGSSSTEPETSDDDDHLLTLPFSTSPQSTLFGCDRPGSTPGSPTGPVQLGDDDVSSETATLDLLNKAAGEVAKIKLTKNTPSTAAAGTGFFDCSNAAKKRDSVGTGVFLPRGVTVPAQPKKKSEGKATKTKNNKSSQRQNNSRPAKVNEEVIGLPSEWVY
ncbi:hypothetical protein KSS87_003635 [Heliosperma pusillum]|nr:hypothetical protein KSS87_003635 [Heliosperma pusillum]